MDEQASIPSTIPQTLLEAAKIGNTDAWSRLVTKYFPLVYGWCRKVGLQPADSADVTQDVFRGIVCGINRFHREEKRATFRGWLRRITQRRIIDFRRAQFRQRGTSNAGVVIKLISEKTIQPSIETTNSCQPQRETMQIISNIQAEFEPTTWQAFYRTAVDNASPADVAEDLGISLNAVYLAKSRVLRRLRTVLEDPPSDSR